MAHDVVEEIRVTGEELVHRVRDILKEGNVRRLVIKNSRDETVFQLPLTFGVIGLGGAFALAPVLSSIAAFAFFARDARILVERHPPAEGKRLKNELEDEEITGRRGYGRRRDRDSYEIDADFEILDP